MDQILEQYLVEYLQPEMALLVPVLLAGFLVPVLVLLAGSLVLPAVLPESVPGLHILQGWS